MVLCQGTYPHRELYPLAAGAASALRNHLLNGNMQRVCPAIMCVIFCVLFGHNEQPEIIWRCLLFSSQSYRGVTHQAVFSPDIMCTPSPNT